MLKFVLRCWDWVAFSSFRACNKSTSSPKPFLLWCFRHTKTMESVLNGNSKQESVHSEHQLQQISTTLQQQKHEGISETYFTTNHHQQNHHVRVPDFVWSMSSKMSSLAWRVGFGIFKPFAAMVGLVGCENFRFVYRKLYDMYMKQICIYIYLYTVYLYILKQRHICIHIHDIWVMYDSMEFLTSSIWASQTKSHQCGFPQKNFGGFPLIPYSSLTLAEYPSLLDCFCCSSHFHLENMVVGGVALERCGGQVKFSKKPISNYPKNPWDVGRGVKLPPVFFSAPKKCHEREGLVFP